MGGKNRKKHKGGKNKAQTVNAQPSQPATPPVLHDPRDPTSVEEDIACISDEEDYSDSDYEGDEGYRKGGYHPVSIGDVFKNGRYVVLRKLGWGHFSTVWLVHDRHTDGLAALKVQKSATHYTEAARDEIKLLTEIHDGDPNDECCCCRILDDFEHVGPHGRHVCMVFEVLGENLLALVKKFNYQGIPLPVVRNLARQILIGLDYLHRVRQIIHTDLKPENVMLTQPINPREWKLPAINTTVRDLLKIKVSQAEAANKPLTKNQKKKLKKKLKKTLTASSADEMSTTNSMSKTLDESDTAGTNEVSNLQTAGSGVAHSDVTAEDRPTDPGSIDGQADRVFSAPVLTIEQLVTAGCKIVDFGNACWRHRHFTDDIQTRQYRSPEVILGQGYDTSTDLWSLACMIFEIATGDLLFDPREAKDKSYSRDEDHLALMMELNGALPLSMTLKGTHASKYFQCAGGDLRHIKDLKYWPLNHVLVEKYDMDPREAQGLNDFLLPMLRFDPAKRATAQEMLQHPWLRGELPEAPPVLVELSSKSRHRNHEVPCEPPLGDLHAPDEDILPGASGDVDDYFDPAHFIKRYRSAPGRLAGGDDAARYARLVGYDEETANSFMRYAVPFADLMRSHGDFGSEHDLSEAYSGLYEGDLAHPSARDAMLAADDLREWDIVGSRDHAAENGPLPPRGAASERVYTSPVESTMLEEHMKMLGLGGNGEVHSMYGTSLIGPDPTEFGPDPTEFDNYESEYDLEEEELDKLSGEVEESSAAGQSGHADSGDSPPVPVARSGPFAVLNAIDLLRAAQPASTAAADEANRLSNGSAMLNGSVFGTRGPSHSEYSVLTPHDAALRGKTGVPQNSGRAANGTLNSSGSSFTGLLAGKEGSSAAIAVGEGFDRSCERESFQWDSAAGSSAGSYDGRQHCW